MQYKKHLNILLAEASINRPGSLAEELTKLSSLPKVGILTDEEFALSVSAHGLEVFRGTFEEQDKLYAQGRTKSGKKVPAQGWKQFGHVGS